MADQSRSIFRSNAVKHYLENSKKDVLPRLVKPPVFAFMWLLLGLLLAGLLLAWNTSVPVYAAGNAVLTGPEGVDEAGLLVFLPPGSLPAWSAGQSVRLEFEEAGKPAFLIARVQGLDLNPVSPTQARNRYRLDEATTLAITRPSIVLKLIPETQERADRYAGSVLPVRVRTGSQRLTALLPLPFVSQGGGVTND